MSDVIEVYTNCYAEDGLGATLEHLPLPGCRAVEIALKRHLVDEVMVTEESTLTEISADDQVQVMKARFRAAGITISTANGGDTLSDPDGADRVRRRMDIAERLGVKTFVASFGWKQDDLDGIYPRIRELGEYARDRGMVLGLETHAPIVTNAEAALRTLEAVACDNVGINWDTANIYYMNEDIDGASELRRVADRVVHVHLKDSRMKCGEWFFPALGEGAIDFLEIRDILEAAGFKGTMSLEIEGIKGEVADLGLRRKRVEDSLIYLQKIGLLNA